MQRDRAVYRRKCHAGCQAEVRHGTLPVARAFARQVVFSPDLGTPSFVSWIPVQNNSTGVLGFAERLDLVALRLLAVWEEGFFWLAFLLSLWISRDGDVWVRVWEKGATGHRLYISSPRFFSFPCSNAQPIERLVRETLDAPKCFKMQCGKCSLRVLGFYG